MDTTEFKAYDLDDYITEIYDQTETYSDDVFLLCGLIGKSRSLRILEPFCGNGRILIPLARDGHHIVGMDKSQPMLNSARRKIQELPEKVQGRIKLIQADVTTDQWPVGFDLVILGGNCFYELPSADMQEHCIRSAQHSLRDGGYLYLDNNHMEGDLAVSWQDLGVVHKNRFPTGECADGTRVTGTMETIWFDAEKRLVRFRRTVKLRSSSGETKSKAWIQQKHPPSTLEMKAWLQRHGFVVEHLWGDRKQSPYTDESARAIFWARLAKKG